jgi:ribosome-binding factor A
VELLLVVLDEPLEHASRLLQLMAQKAKHLFFAAELIFALDAKLSRAVLTSTLKDQGLASATAVKALSFSSDLDELFSQAVVAEKHFFICERKRL